MFDYNIEILYRLRMRRIVIIMIIMIIILCFCLVYLRSRHSIKEGISNNFPIDVVYTWSGESYTNDIRSSNNNELKFSLRSVHKFLPWVRHIFVLMNPPKQKPSWFSDNYSKYITLVDHKEVFPDTMTNPITNSNAIETTLYRIPGLSEHFIYFNDDVFIGRPLPRSYFFTNDGKAIVSNHIKNNREMMIDNKKNTLGFKLPPSCNIFYPHVPISFLKSQFISFVNTYPEYIDWVRSQRTRKYLGCDTCKNMICPCQQIHAPVLIHTSNNNKTQYTSYASQGYINSDTLNLLSQIFKDPPQTFCINDTEENENKRLEMIQKFNNFFMKMYPEKPPFEK